jgi:hypothetical protein
MQIRPTEGGTGYAIGMLYDHSGLGMPLPNYWIMDGNTGRSEGATAEKAVPFPCAVLDPNRSFLEPRVGEPRAGARSALCIFARTSSHLYYLR